MHFAYIIPHTISQIPNMARGNMETETLILNLGSQAAAALAAALTILIATCCRPTATAKSRPQSTGPNHPAHGHEY